MLWGDRRALREANKVYTRDDGSDWDPLSVLTMAIFVGLVIFTLKC